MRLLRTVTLSVLPAVLVVAGCGGGGDGVTADGEVALQWDGVQTGFVFDGPTRLQDDRRGAVSGEVSGHCIVRDDPAAVEVRLARPPGADADLGLRIFDAWMPREGMGQVSGEVGGTAFTVQPDSGACAMGALYVEPGDGVAGLEVDCPVGPSSTDVRGRIVTELHLAGCD